MYQIVFYVPESHIETVKSALFQAGAGTIENYTCCCWQVRGEGQYMPLKGSNAFKGTVNQLEKTTEYKVELVCDKKQIHAVISALKQSHPYETPAYYVVRCEDL